MDRLTFEGNFCDIVRCTEVRGGSFCEDGFCSQRKVWERLKEYEDIGTVEEFAELKQAKSDGRIVELSEDTDDYDRAFIRMLAAVINNDYAIYSKKKKYIYKSLHDMNEEVFINAECEYLKKDSYGVDGSEFKTCSCTDYDICSFSGSEFKRWDKDDLDPFECGCYIRFGPHELGKNIFLTREAAEAALTEMEKKI